jgi:hypothetical protein
VSWTSAQALSSARWAYRRATAPARGLPAFLIIGAQRAGSTSLFEYLCSHPKIAPPTHKEIHFFDDNWWRGLNWYRRFFPLARPGTRVLTGEASPYYLFHPAVPERVAASCPEVRLIVLLRDPIARAHSQYHHARRCGYERLSFKDALRLEPKRLAGEEQRILVDSRQTSFSHRRHSYATRGLYADQLERWLAFFRPQQLLVLRSEDLLAHTDATFRAALEFLDLPAVDLADQPRLNSGEYGSMSPEVRAHLANYYREPNRRLSELLGRDFGWDCDSGRVAASAPATPSSA